MNDDLSTSEKLVKRDVDALNQNAEQLQELRKRWEAFSPFKSNVSDFMRRRNEENARDLAHCIRENTLDFIQAELTRAKIEGAEEVLMSLKLPEIHCQQCLKEEEKGVGHGAWLDALGCLERRKIKALDEYRQSFLTDKKI